MENVAAFAVCHLPASYRHGHRCAAAVAVPSLGREIRCHHTRAHCPDDLARDAGAEPSVRSMAVSVI